MSESAFFQDLAILMSIAGVVAVLFARFGWPKAIGYILAGIVLNEHTWGGGFLKDAASTQVIGQLGVVFLMFGMGLSFSAKEMKKIKAVALPAAVLDTVVMIWLGYMVGTRLFGWGPVPSVFLGVAICDSATTLLAKVIDEMGWTSRPFAKAALGTSVCEDIICVGAIAVATGFANGDGMSLGALAGSLGWLFVFFLSVLVFGLILVPRLLKSVAARRDDEALVLTLLGCCFLVSFIAYHAEFSLALGAFLVGVIGAMSDVRDRIAALVEPLKSMFSAVFFVSIGLLVDPAALWHHLPEILLVSAVVVGGKTANVLTASLASGVGVKTAVQTAMSLAQIGEFAFMVAILYAGLVGDSTNPMFPIAVGVSLVTTLLNPVMIRSSERVGAFAERRLPAKFHRGLDTYRAWLGKISASDNAPARILLKNAAIKLGVYAVLMFSVSTVCSILYKVDYTRFSPFFEKYDQYFFYGLVNIFAFSLVPLIVPASRTIGDEVAEMLSQSDNSRWRLALCQLVRTLTLCVVLGLFFVEWAMINFSMSPLTGWPQWTMTALMIALAAFGWQWLVKAGRRATLRFNESLSNEERRAGLVETTTITVPEGVINRLRIGASSPAIGESVVSLNIRAKTGASVVSVYRNGELTRNIGREWTFLEGDVLVALGEPREIAALKDLLGII